MLSAKILWERGLHENAAFHVQQAAEKALKALLIASEIHPPRSHNIQRLVHLCELQGIQLPSTIKEYADILSSYAVLTRYPDVEGQIFVEEMRFIMDSVEELLNLVVKELAAKGIKC
ncbi:MAG: HEPN domain-containing protein [Candidatus Diapherotrites archaeon]|nr:HEPN domain-containing protein [Candidatus Diapherotrites archaeon]